MQNGDILTGKMHLHFFLRLVYQFKGQYAERVPSIHQETFGIRLTPRLN